MIPSFPEILFEDNHLIAVNKRPGDIVQGDKTGDTPLSESVKEYIKQKYQKPGAVFLGVIHRIDRPVSGVVLFARTSKSLERMNRMFRDKEINKMYWAVVKQPPPQEQDSLIRHLVKNERLNKSFAHMEPVKGSLESRLDYRVIGKSDHYFLLQINPITGRHHQIRVMLSSIGCPIKGDLKYGFARSNPDGSIHLHARGVTFTHPVSGELMHIQAKSPENDPVWKAFSQNTPDKLTPLA
ncbi:MAG: RNA pseudouridine synthase [Sphingobacteriales bacterium]|jgi:23S rRNA pseudouridine1911/1915/1917 synthase|nr:RNA pseudouridine synthase [Sphingobacteriales bacterium]